MFEHTRWMSYRFGERSVAEIDAHLRRHTEESGDQVVRLKNAVLVHKLDEYHECLKRNILKGFFVTSLDPK